MLSQYQIKVPMYVRADKKHYIYLSDIENLYGSPGTFLSNWTKTEDFKEHVREFPSHYFSSDNELMVHPILAMEYLDFVYPSNSAAKTQISEFIESHRVMYDDKEFIASVKGKVHVLKLYKSNRITFDELANLIK